MEVEVEKELPDYILSIITNRKDKDYMTKSLSVFMGSKANAFTEWVYNISTRIVNSQKPDRKISPNPHVENNSNTEDTMKNRKRRSEIKNTIIQDSEIHVKRGEFAQTEKDHDSHKRSAHKNGALSDRQDREHLKESHRSAKSPSAMETEGDQSIPAPKVASSVVRLINPFDDIPRASKVASKVIVKRKVPDVPKSQTRAHSSIFQKAMEAVKNPTTSRPSKNSVFVELEERPSSAPERYFTVRIELEPGWKNLESTRKVVDGDSENSMKTERINSTKAPSKADAIKRESNTPSLERFSVHNKSNVSDETNIIEVTPIANLNLSSLSNMHENGHSYKVRCKYWPECVNKNCGYIHPNKPCQNFPKCIFGTECVFIHPPCRYAKECKNEYCTYTHGSRAALQQMVEIIELSSELHKVDSETSQSHTLCYFAGNCTNKTCKYKHPPRCSFGERCTKYKTCTFYHGPIGRTEAPKSQYYWRSTA